MFKYKEEVIMSASVASALTIVLSIIATIVCVIFFVPKKNREKFGKGFAKIHDFMNFKIFIVDYILKALYVLATAMCIFGGFLTIFTVKTVYTTTGTMFNQTREAQTSLSADNIGTGILIMILGPIIVRIVYELIMLAVVGVKNIIEINKKIPNAEEPKTPVEPTTPMEPTQPTKEEQIVEAAENSSAY